MSELSNLKSQLNLCWSIAINFFKQSLFTNASYLVGIEVLKSFIGFIFWGLATQLYAPTEIGLASSLIAAVTLVSLIAGLGTGNGLIRFLPESPHPNRMLNSLFIFNNAAAFIVGGLILLGLTYLSPSLAFLGQDLLLVVGFLAFGIITTFAGSLRWTYVAMRRASYAFWQSAWVNVSRLLLLIVFTGFGVWGIVGSVGLAFFVSILIGFFVYLPRAMPSYQPCFTLAKIDLLRILPFSLGTYLAFLLIQAPTRLLPIIVLESIGADSAAHVQIAWLVGGMLVMPGLALGTSAFVEASNSPKISTDIFSKAWLSGFPITILIALFMFVVAPWFLFLFGPSYSSEGTPLLKWLAAAAPLVVMVSIYFSLLRFQKRIRRLIVLSSVVAVATLSFTVGLIPFIGIKAVGLGWFFGYLLVTLVAIKDVLVGNSINGIWLYIQKFLSRPSS